MQNRTGPVADVPQSVARRAERMLSLCREGRLQSAARMLTRTVEIWPQTGRHLLQLTKQACAAGEASRAAALSDLVVRTDPGSVPLVLWQADILAACGRSGAARQALKSALALASDKTALRQRLRRLNPRHREALPRALAQARDAVSTEDHGRALAVLRDVLDRFGPDPAIIAFLFQQCLLWAPAQIMPPRAVGKTETVQAGLPEELRRRAHLFATDYRAALAGIRSDCGAMRQMRDARDIAQCLAGMHRYELAIRYLRFCLRRWPAAWAIFRELFELYMRLGHYDLAAVMLDGPQGARPEFADRLAELRVLHLCYTGPVEGALSIYDRDIAAEPGYLHLRKILLRRTIGEALVGKAGQIEQRLKELSKNRVTQHWQSFQIGQIMNELRLLRSEMPAGETEGGRDVPVDEDLSLADLRNLVAAHPRSTILAIRYVARVAGDFRRPQNDDAPGQTPIPRRIAQYWDQQSPPEQMQDYMESWRRIPDREYRVYSMVSAQKFMAEEMGQGWLRAFRLTRRAAEQADLLRLCLLVRHGGIWADADDYLYGDLDGLIPPTAGLVLYREPVGGAIANNFMAARPGHPVLVYAAELVRDALLQRSSETIWLKSGPGMLTRALGQYLVRADPETVRRDLVLWDQADIRRQISIHNRVFHKAAGGHWNGPDRTDPGYFPLFQAALAEQKRQEDWEGWPLADGRQV